MNTLQKTIALIGLCTLSACTTHNKVDNSPYSDKFIKSSFYRGHAMLEKGKDCNDALKHFQYGIDNNEFPEISILYYDYCTKSLTSTSHYFYISYTEIQSGQTAEWYQSGVSEDEFIWINNQADQGGVVEQYAKAQMLFNGHMLDKDADSALYYLTQSAFNGYGRAQMQLAIALLDIDEQQNALLWFEKASQNDYPGAAEMLDGLKLILDK